MLMVQLNACFQHNLSDSIELFGLVVWQALQQLPKRDALVAHIYSRL